MPVTLFEETAMRIRLPFSTLALLSLAACAPPATKPEVPPAPAPAAVSTAQLAEANLSPASASLVSGRVAVVPEAGGVHITGTIGGLPQGKPAAFHVHEKGDCSAPDGTSAGGHFNPASAEHGSIDAAAHHGGDMPNLVADVQGNAHVDGPVSSNVNAGKGDDFDIIGRGLIVHADPDDYTSQPTGNAGARLACAVITKAE